MLTTDLLINRAEGPQLVPFALDAAAEAPRALAGSLVELYRAHQGRTRGELTAALDAHAGVGLDYKVQRGLAKIIADDCCAFEVHSVAPPVELRERLFRRAAEEFPVALTPDLLHPVAARDVVGAVAAELTAQLGRPIDPAEVEGSLYADLREHHVLTEFRPPETDWLLNRYNLAQAQGLLYRCTGLRLVAQRNLPARYKQLFKFIKFYGLMHQVQGDLDAGYEIALDGPASLFRLTDKYGLTMAAFLPALLLCTRWQMEAEVWSKDRARRWTVTLNSASTDLRSHYTDPARYDSLLEERFAERFLALRTPWQLERETEVINLLDTVMIPDFAFRHPDGRTMHLEIVGYWRRDYLARKLTKLRRAGRADLIVAVSSHLQVDREAWEDLVNPLLFFKGSLDPREVLRLLDAA